jgi:NAD(P)-dependent dehydrogenase (short-subunit alcohol dehydrogenase family)
MSDLEHPAGLPAARRHAVAEAVDAALDWLVVPSYTRIGYEARRRLFGWSDPTAHDLTGRVVVVTGATSGLGRATAARLAAAGATVVAVGRDRDRTEATAEELRREAGNPEVGAVVADLGDLAAVRAAAEAIADRHRRVDVLVHNAGALLHQRSETADGIEATVASQVVGPFLLTALLLDRLAAPAADPAADPTARRGPGRVVTVSSGGMYAADLTVAGLELTPDAYDGTKQYALAKRAQVTLNELWAERVDPASVVFHAMHPGWADTPGVATALPTFRRVVGPLLRDAASGADTTVWLAADDGEPVAATGRFWLDRRPRPIHRLPSTRRSDTPARREELWAWVAERALGDAGWRPSPAAPAPAPTATATR